MPPAVNRVFDEALSLPVDARVGLVEQPLVLAKIERGIAQADRKETIERQAVIDRMAKWLK